MVNIHTSYIDAVSRALGIDNVGRRSWFQRWWRRMFPNWVLYQLTSCGRILVISQKLNFNLKLLTWQKFDESSFLWRVTTVRICAPNFGTPPNSGPCFVCSPTVEGPFCHRSLGSSLSFFRFQVLQKPKPQKHIPTMMDFCQDRQRLSAILSKELATFR